MRVRFLRAVAQSHAIAPRGVSIKCMYCCLNRMSWLSNSYVIGGHLSSVEALRLGWVQALEEEAALCSVRVYHSLPRALVKGRFLERALH